MKPIHKLMLSAALIAACFTTALYAVEAAVTAPEAAASTQLIAPWLQAVIGVVLSVVGTMLLPMLHNLAAAARVNATTSSLTQREALLKQVKVFLFEQADTLAVDRWPALALKIQSGQLKDSAAIKAELYLWGEELKKNVIAYFAANGLDLIKTFGEPAIDDLITLAANHTSPFPGKEAAVEVLQHNIIPLLLQNGVRWLRDHYFNNGATPIVDAVTLPTPADGSRAVRIYYKVVTV